MKLKVQQTSGISNNVHKELVSAVGWNAFNELYSCSDDKTVCRWDMHGDAGGKVGAVITHEHKRARHTHTTSYTQQRGVTSSRTPLPAITYFF